MSDSEKTRFVQLAPDIEREPSRNERTRFGTLNRVALVDHRALFTRHQRRLHQVLREFPRPGVAVFALHPRKGLVGRLWLAGTDAARAGTIGRHSEVDLYLPHDEELSLRHLLVLVRASPNGQRIRVVDLATPGGFQAEQGGVLRAVDANGAIILNAASYSLFLFPTGTPPPWSPDAGEPWLTLPERILVSDERPEQRLRLRSPLPRRSGSTDVSFREGPSEAGAEPLLQPGESARGHLALDVNGSVAQLSVGAQALGRGVILGRYARCCGDTAAMSIEVSRVHAILLEVEGTLLIIDTGSTNGVFAGTAEVKCAPVVPGLTYALGKLGVCWTPTH